MRATTITAARIKREREWIEAAAPELLEACKQALPLLRIGNSNNMYSKCADKLEHAIAWAEGTL